MRFRLDIFLTIVLAVCFTAANAQIIKGLIYSREDAKPLPFVNVLVKGSQNGTVTDTMGRYSLKIPKGADSLKISAVGYKPTVVKIKLSPAQMDTIFLQASTYAVSEVTIRPGENPAFRVLRKVYANRPRHDLNYLDFYQYEMYDKVEFDLNNIGKNPGKTLFKKYDFVWNKLDTSGKKSFLPVFITETLSDYYYRKEPRSGRQHIQATKVSGYDNPQISQAINELAFNINLYDDFNSVFNKNFPSPLNQNLETYYRYYLDDSIIVEGRRYYLINFRPKNDRDVAYEGRMLIDDSDYAVKEVEMNFNETGNINYVRSFAIRQEYHPIDSGRWMLTRNTVLADITPLERSEKMFGLFARKTTSYRNIILNKEAEKQKYAGGNNVIISDSATLHNEEYWNRKRHEALSRQEKGIYNMVDTLNRRWGFRLLKGAVRVIGSGYLRVWKLEIGLIHSFVSWNPVEGYRFKYGMRTTRKLTKKFEAEAYLAYGLRDKRFKYFGELIYYPLGIYKLRHNVGVSYKYDMEQIGMSGNALPLDHFMTALFRTGTFNRLTLSKDFRFWYEHNWFDGFTTRLGVVFRDVTAPGDFKFQRYLPNGSVETLPGITNAELRFSARFAFREKQLSSDFTRRVFINKYPVLALEVGKGFKDLIGSDYSYLRAKLRVNYRLKMAKLGFTDFMLEGGKVWGNVPFHMLEVHTGNQNIVNDETAFNLMRFFEYVSDQYVTIHMENHFEGFFLNRIPLIKKLKWREFIVNKVLVGGLSPSNRNAPVIFPEGLTWLKQPYWETGFGLENIFKVLRVDFLWRVGYIENKLSNRWTIKPSLYLRF